MRNTFLLLFVLAMTGAMAQVNFVETKDLNQLLKQARKENKFVFVDAFTYWCGWCKELDKKVFPTAEMGEIMGRYFISTKIEMEQDSIGVMLARKYAIRAFPTGIILNGEGELINLVDGYSEPADYAKRVLTAIEPSNRVPVGAYSTSFDIAYPGFYTAMMPSPGVKKKMSDSTTVNAYLEKQQNLSEEQNWVVIQASYFWLNDMQFKRILSQHNAIANRYGSKAYEHVVELVLSSKISRCIRSKDQPCVVSYLNVLEREVKDGKSKRPYYMENFYEQNKMWEELAGHITQQMRDSTYAANVYNLNERAWAMYEKCEDKAALEQAVTWMVHVIKVKPVYTYLDTYAALLYKTDRYAEARQYAERAIDAGRKSGDDVKGTEELLEKINKVKK